VDKWSIIECSFGSLDGDEIRERAVEKWEREKQQWCNFSGSNRAAVAISLLR
jgi:hypothetical protein